MDGHDDDEASGQKETSGGSSDTDVKLPMARPTGWPPGARPVTTVTPVG
jgi:hypothetical protein